MITRGSFVFVNFGGGKLDRPGYIQRGGAKNVAQRLRRKETRGGEAAFSDHAYKGEQRNREKDLVCKATVTE